MNDEQWKAQITKRLEALEKMVERLMFEQRLLAMTMVPRPDHDHLTLPSLDHIQTMLEAHTKKLRKKVDSERTSEEWGSPEHLTPIPGRSDDSVDSLKRRLFSPSSRKSDSPKLELVSSAAISESSRPETSEVPATAPPVSSAAPESGPNKPSLSEPTSGPVEPSSGSSQPLPPEVGDPKSGESGRNGSSDA